MRKALKTLEVPFEERRQAGRPVSTRGPILRAARDLFLQHGFEDVSMDALADAAGVARRSLYNQFPSKEDVFRAVLELLWLDLDSELLREAEASGEVRPALTMLGAALAAHWQKPDNIALNRMIITEARRFPWIAHQFRVRYDAMVERFVRAIRVGVTHGQLSCDKPRVAATQFVSLLSGFLLWPQMHGTPPVDERETPQLVAEAVEMFVSRYGRPAGRARHR